MATNRNNLKIVYWNAQSISKKIIEFYDFLKNNNIDVALVCETWLKRDTKLLNNTNFSIYRLDRECTNHGGVAIFVKKSVKHKSLQYYNTKVIEAIGIEIFCKNNRTISLISAYYPGTNASSENFNHFRSDIRLLTQNSNSYFICGDLNSKHNSWGCSRANASGKILFDLYKSKRFNIHYPNAPTHWPSQRNYRPSVIDLVLSNDINSISQLTTLNQLSSDHFPVCGEIDCLPYNNPVTTKYI